MPLPKETTTKENILYRLNELKKQDPDPRGGKMFSYVFYANKEIEEVGKEAYNAFMQENGIAPTTFTALKNMENEVVSIASSLLNGDADVVGNLTSGGTESLLLVVKTARDFARTTKPEIIKPEIIVPITVHSSLFKGGIYFDVKIIVVPVDSITFKVDINAVRNAITANTIMLVGSTPNYSQGTIDDIESLGSIALENNLLLHVDACMGGIVLPIIKEIGYPVPPFDFKVKGVTSISVDLHKFAYTPKGCSVLLWKNKELRKHQYFACNEWTGYALVNPTMTSTKPGGSIAAAWAVMNFLGMEGYKKLMGDTMIAVDKMINGINEIEHLKVLGKPEATLISFTSEKYNIHKICDELTELGWTVTPQLAIDNVPASIHLTVTYGNIYQVDNFIEDLKKAEIGRASCRERV